MKTFWLLSLTLSLQAFGQSPNLNLDEVIDSLEKQEKDPLCDDKELEARAKSFKLSLTVNPEEPTNPAFERIRSNIVTACETQEPNDGYSDLVIIDCVATGAGRDKRYPAGVSIQATSKHPLISSRVSPYGKDKSITRLIKFISRNNSSNETFLYLADMAGGPDSHDMKSIMVLLPRKTPPHAEVSGNEVLITLPTGEIVSFNKNNQSITGGVLKEGPLDLNSDRHSRKPPSIEYQGSGISIRLNHRYLDPALSSDTATIRQGTKSCQIPRTHLFKADGTLITTSDAELVRSLNKICPSASFRI